METLKTEKSKSQFMKAYVVAEGKAGKTSFLVASILGALPHQKQGLVTSPSHLHVLGFDSNAVGGLADFLTKLCKKDDRYLEVDVHNMQDPARKVAESQGDWDYSFYQAVIAKVQVIRNLVKTQPGVHAVLVSSLTGLAEALQRGMSGPPNASKKGGGMDQAKWQDLSRQLIEIRNLLQVDTHHVFWEGHVYKVGSGDDTRDAAGVPGTTGRNWGFNVEQTLRLRRETAKYPNTLIDKQYLDTKPTLDFTSSGRGFTGVLADKEYNLVDIATKLGYKVGGYSESASAL